MTLILLKNKGQYVFSSFFYFILVLWSSILKFMIEVRDISPLGIVLQIFSQFVLFFDFSFEIFCLDLLLFRRRPWHPTPILLPGKSHGRRSLVGCSPWGHEESDTAEPLHFHFSLSCIGEGNGNPLQCSCLENPRDGGARWAAVYGVAQSRTQLKWLSSSSSSIIII